MRATRTWLGHMSSVAQTVLERMDGMISERTPDAGRRIVLIDPS